MMVSSKKNINKITNAEITGVNIASLSDRPNSSARYGIGDLTAQGLKERFDAFPKLVQERLNAIIGALSSQDAAKYITLDGSIGGVDNLYDFLTLFVYENAENEGSKIEDYINVLYQDLTDEEEKRISLQSFVYKFMAWQAKIERESAGYDLVIYTEKDFSKCLYPLFQDESLTKEEAIAVFQAGTAALGTPTEGFTAKRILVKNVTFKERRGYDDIRMHIFQPSIEYIKFENCRWEAPWRVSGARPEVLKKSKTEFEPVKDLQLTIEGIHVTEDNVRASVEVFPTLAYTDLWHLGFRNLKAIINCEIDYPEDYVLMLKTVPSSGDLPFYSFKLTCQYFEHAVRNRITALWDGANVTNCQLTETLMRCHNCANIFARPIDLELSSGTVSVMDSSHLSNFKGAFVYTRCASVDEFTCEGYNNTNSKFLKALTTSPGTETNSNYQQLFLYARNNTGADVYKAAMPQAGGGYIPIRDDKGHLWLPQSTPQMDQAISLREAKKRFPELSDGKVPAKYLPSYVDDVIEGGMSSSFGEFFPSKGQDVEVDKNGNVIPRKGVLYLDVEGEHAGKVFRWGGTYYVEISNGNLPVPDFYQNYLVPTTFNGTYTLMDPNERFKLDTPGASNSGFFVYSDGKRLCYRHVREMPLVEGYEHVGKTLIFDETGNWSAELKNFLPEVGESDEGKILQVAGGNWSAADNVAERADEAYQIVTLDGTNLKLFIGTRAEYDALSDKSNILAFPTDDTTKEDIIKAIKKFVYSFYEAENSDFVLLDTVSRDYEYDTASAYYVHGELKIVQYRSDGKYKQLYPFSFVIPKNTVNNVDTIARIYALSDNGIYGAYIDMKYVSESICTITPSYSYYVDINEDAGDFIVCTWCFKRIGQS